MSTLVSLVLVLCVGCATAGLVDHLVTDAAAEFGRGKLDAGYGCADINPTGNGGYFAMELVRVKEGSRVIDTLVRLSWHKTPGTYHTLHLVKMNCPYLGPSVPIAMGSIKPVMNNDGSITVTYFKESIFIKKNYKWQNNGYYEV